MSPMMQHPLPDLPEPDWAQALPGIILVDRFGWEPVIYAHTAPYAILWRAGVCMATTQDALAWAERIRTELAEGTYW